MIYKYTFWCLLLIAGISQALAQSKITSTKVTGEIPEKDFNSQIWAKAQVTSIPLNPQNIIPPVTNTQTINEIKVRSINNGQTIAFFLEWNDTSRNAFVDANIFTDQVAIQIPMDPKANPSFMMGNQGGAVHIIHWKAIWQDDIEKGYRDVKHLHPNYWTDLYHFQENNAPNQSVFQTTPPKTATVNDFKSPQGKNYMPGAYAGNPMSIFDRKTPAEECNAEGYGTLATQNQQDAKAWGTWNQGTWKVIITRPIASPDTKDAPLNIDKTIVGFAVWDGKVAHRGGKKHYSQWTDLEIQK